MVSSARYEESFDASMTANKGAVVGQALVAGTFVGASLYGSSLYLQAQFAAGATLSVGGNQALRGYFYANELASRGFGALGQLPGVAGDVAVRGLVLAQGLAYRNPISRGVWDGALTSTLDVSLPRAFSTAERWGQRVGLAVGRVGYDLYELVN